MNKRIIAISVFILIAVIGIPTSVYFVVREAGEADIREQAATSFEPITQSVLVITYDAHTIEGHTEYPYNDTSALSAEFTNLIEEASRFHAYQDDSSQPEVDYVIVDEIVIEEESPLIVVDGGRSFADYQTIFEENNICGLVNEGSIDEVWMWTDRTGRYWLDGLAGAEEDVSFYYQSLFVEECERPVFMMGMNYEEPNISLGAFSHRAQKTLAYLLDDKWWADAETGDTSFEYDGMGQSPDVGQTGYCGHGSYPPNAEDIQEYDNTKVITTDCEDWSPQHTGTERDLDCSAWNCTEYGFYDWWFQNMPGRCNNLTTLESEDMSNWWWLITKLDSAEPEWDCTECTPDCTEKECGDDGCGGTCGTCESSEACSGGVCIPEEECTPDCTGKECGDDSCGGTCGDCDSGETCTDYVCVQEVCTPDCTGKECGNDGCGGSCGNCDTGESCDDYTCVADCTPDCDGKECGSDGCGGVCGEGTCGEGYVCDEGTCIASACTPDCTGKECGDDGCGGECSPGCDLKETCEYGLCVDEEEPVDESSPADIDGNGEVEMADYYVFVQDYLKYKLEGELEDRSDLNNDGQMSMSDYSIFVEEYLKAKLS